MDRPSIVFVMADDHAAHALSCYGSERNTAPQLDRLAVEGMRFDRCCCANSICSPSRATILTGTHSHINGVTTLDTPFDARQETFPALLRDAGTRPRSWAGGTGPRRRPRSRAGPTDT
jgi:arylsulfatase A-like enzyme